MRTIVVCSLVLFMLASSAFAGTKVRVDLYAEDLQTIEPYLRYCNFVVVTFDQDGGSYQAVNWPGDTNHDPLVEVHTVGNYPYDFGEVFGDLSEHWTGDRETLICQSKEDSSSYIQLYPEREVVVDNLSYYAKNDPKAPTIVWLYNVPQKMLDTLRFEYTVVEDSTSDEAIVPYDEPDTMIKFAFNDNGQGLYAPSHVRQLGSS